MEVWGSVYDRVGVKRHGYGFFKNGCDSERLLREVSSDGQG